MGIKFFNEFYFEWNAAGNHDWDKIRRNFVAAYISSYRNKTIQQLQFDDSLLENAKTIFQQSAEQGYEHLISNVIKPLQFYLNHEKSPLKEECMALKEYFLDSSSDISSVRDKIVKLIMLQHYFEEDFKQEYPKIMNGTKKIDYLIVRYHEQPIAFFVTEPNYKSGHIYLRFVTMAPAFHRLGLGKLSLAQIAKHYPETTGMELYTRKANDSARTFYERCGFSECQFDFSEPDWQDNILHFPNDDSTNHPEAFVGYSRIDHNYR